MKRKPNGLYYRYRKWKQKDFLEWRFDLSEYEKDLFIPEMKGRSEELLKYFNEIDAYCTERVDEKVFGALLRELALDSRIEHLIPVELRPATPEVLARNFFTEIKNVNRTTFIEPLEEIVSLFKEDMSLKEFGNMLNRLNLVCSTVVQVKNKLFYYNLRSFAVAFDEHGAPALRPPMNLQVILMPFENTIVNVLGVANATSGSIHQWHKEQMRWKTEFLKVVSERIAQRNNLLTILVAVALSWLFLTFSSPYDKIRLENESIQMHTFLNRLTKQNNFLINENLSKEQVWNKKMKDLQAELNKLKNFKNSMK